MYLLVLRYSTEDVLKAAKSQLERKIDPKSNEFWTCLVTDLLQFYTRSDFMQDEALKLKRNFIEYLFCDQLLKSTLGNRNYVRLKQLSEQQGNNSCEAFTGFQVDQIQEIADVNEYNSQGKISNNDGVSAVQIDFPNLFTCEKETESEVAEPDFIVSTDEESNSSEPSDVVMFADRDDDLPFSEVSLNISANNVPSDKSVCSREKNSTINTIPHNCNSSIETVQSLLSGMVNPEPLKQTSPLQQPSHKSAIQEKPSPMKHTPTKTSSKVTPKEKTRKVLHEQQEMQARKKAPGNRSNITLGNTEISPVLVESFQKPAGSRGRILRQLEEIQKIPKFPTDWKMFRISFTEEEYKWIVANDCLVEGWDRTLLEKLNSACNINLSGVKFGNKHGCYFKAYGTCAELACGAEYTFVLSSEPDFSKVVDVQMYVGWSFGHLHSAGKIFTASKCRKETEALALKRKLSKS